MVPAECDASVTWCPSERGDTMSLEEAARELGIPVDHFKKEAQ